VTSSVRAILDSTAFPNVALNRLRSEYELPRLFEELHSDSSLIEAINKSGQFHDNGFQKLTLHASGDTKLKLVLHFWPSGADRTNDDNIHNHRWDFSSVVLGGCLRSEVFQLDARGKSYSRYLYESESLGGRYSLRMTETARALRVACLDLAAGTSYMWGCEILHRAYAVGSSPVATIIVQGPPSRQSTDVLLRAAYPPVPGSTIRRMDPAAVEEAIQRACTQGAANAWKMDRHAV